LIDIVNENKIATNQRRKLAFMVHLELRLTKRSQPFIKEVK
jgi:hypothetical protein